MKKTNRIIRTSKAKKPSPSTHVTRELMVIVTLFLFWLGLGGFAAHYYLNLQHQTTQLRRECSDKINKINSLKNDIASLEVDVERLQCESHIRFKIRQFKLNLRPTIPQQALNLRVRTHDVYRVNQQETMLVDRGE